MRALVIADSRFVAESIQRSLRSDGSLHVLGYVDGRRSCQEAIAQAQPDAVVLDEMTRRDLAAARAREARSGAPAAKLVVLTGQMDDAWLADVVAAGVHAAISKALQPRAIAMFVHAVCRGAVYHAFEQVEQALPAIGTHSALTRRELEILHYVAEGASNGDIATRLWVTEQTVKFHLSNVYRKLGVSNRTQASHYAHVHHIFEPASTPTEPLSLPQAA